MAGGKLAKGEHLFFSFERPDAQSAHVRPRKRKSEKAIYMQLKELGAPLAFHGLPLLAALP